jgi:acyl-CoA synthetase (AMP-forming)/AMP-acid ligase II
MTSLSHLAESFRAVLRDRATEPLVIAPSESRALTAHDIDQQARDVATALAACKLAAGHLVIVSIGNAAAMPAVVLACLRQGLPLMPVDRSTPAAELRALAGRWQAAAVIVPEAFELRSAESDDDTTSEVTRVAAGHGLAAWTPHAMPAPGRHAPAAVLKLTSGSTGEPRATITEERHLIADVQHITDAMGIGPHTRQLGVIPLSHSYGFSNLVLPLLWRGTPLLLRPQFVPTQVAPDIVSARLETFAGVPFMFEHLARHQALPRLDSLRLVVSAGARLAFDTVTAFHAATGLKVRSFYGSSETGGICFDDSDALDPRVPVGHVMGSTRVDLVPDDDAPEASGRVRVSGPNVIDRYAGDQETAFDGTFLTGDYAHADADGIYVLTGRVPSFVNVAGRKVQPQEVEAALRALPGVSDAVAMGVDDAVRGQALGACLVSEAAWDARSVRAALAPRLAPHKLPRVVVVTRALPLTDRGKVDRAAIARWLASPSSS